MNAHVSEQVEKIIYEFNHFFKDEKAPENIRMKI